MESLRFAFSIDLSTGALTMVANELEFSKDAVGLETTPTHFFDGVAIGRSGDIYVWSGGKNVIYRISKY
ncbi:hypothetical protein SYJ56_02660 [Algoriphagus sp. D3-2-R+10]|uniref:hypothetical protein n=1 Tax=Algoriphagus aurantiacus TaxID=3103948 RepID=UPI002B3B08DB|nr:hypothetical protein [Algoriphagus sp. D3-2-R+10]MEB2774188.1 hypothetical protein [Algoriphagus sp. D3-2-R+10]